MIRRFFSAIVSIGLTSQLVMPGPAHCSEKAENSLQPGFHLQQSSLHIADTEVSLASNKVRFDTKANGISTFIDGDTGKVTILNNKNRTFFVTDVSRWSPTALSVSNAIQYFDYTVLVFDQSGKESYKAFPVTHEKWKNLTKYDTPGRNKDERLTVVGADVISCPTLSQNAHILKAVRKYYNIGPIKAYPLEYESQSRKGSTNKSLTTKLLERKSFSADLVKVPSDYQPAKDMRSVYIDSAATDTLEDMLK
ncbi:MAG TPA: hypothetical protein V6C97_29620 [Oculatellaceae cyanobacterium]